MKCCDSNLWPLDEAHLANNEEKYREEEAKVKVVYSGQECRRTRRLVGGSSKRKESPPSKGNTMLCNFFGSHATWRAQMSIKSVSVSGLKPIHHLIFCNYHGNHATELCCIVRWTMIVNKCWISPKLCSDKSSNFQKVTQSIDERDKSF